MSVAGASSVWGRGGQTRDKRRVFGGGDTLLKDGQQARQLPGDERLGIDPQAGEDLTAEYPIRGLGQRDELILTTDEVIDFTVLHAPKDVFADAVAEVGPRFRVAVDTHAGGR